jgi:ammonium transporter, Amt family
VFATKAVNGGITHEGLVTGAGGYLLGVQALALLVTIGWAFVGTWLIAKLVQRTIGLRVTDAVEIQGLDTAIHAESAYDFASMRAGQSGY